MPFDQHVLTVPALSTLAREINLAHREVTLHAKGMLLEAKRAGEALIQVRDVEKPAEGFLWWIKAHCTFSQPTAYRYIDVARNWQALELLTRDNPDLSLRGALSALDKPVSKGSAKPAFDRSDAEHALKLHALCERGVGGEADNAKVKLSAYADTFGMSAEEAVEKAKGLCPDAGFSASEVKLRDNLRQRTKDQLIDLLFEGFKKNREIEARLEAANSELLNLRAQVNLLQERIEVLRESSAYRTNKQTRRS